MANSTFRAIVNLILQQAGQATVSLDATFNDDSLLEKSQLQAKRFVDLINRRMVGTLRARFLEREFSFNTADGDNNYDIDTTTQAENLIEDSWFITTTGAGTGPLTYLPHEKWREQWPEGETIEGRPRQWILLPPDGTNIDKIAFSPPPGATYAVKYRAYLKPVALTTATQEIAWPSQHEHVLILAGQMFLEMSLSEGKMVDVGQFLETWISELKQLTMGPTDQPPVADLGLRFNSSPRKGLRSAWSPD